MRYVGNGPGGLDYTRTISLLNPVTTPPGNAPRTGTGTFFHLGSKGEMSIVFENVIEPNWTATVCLQIAEDSLPGQYGLTGFANAGSCFPNPRTFFQGSWTGTYTLLTPPSR